MVGFFIGQCEVADLATNQNKYVKIITVWNSPTKYGSISSHQNDTWILCTGHISCDHDLIFQLSWH